MNFQYFYENSNESWLPWASYDKKHKLWNVNYILAKILLDYSFRFWTHWKIVSIMKPSLIIHKLYRVLLAMEHGEVYLLIPQS